MPAYILNRGSTNEIKSSDILINTCGSLTERKYVKLLLGCGKSRLLQ